MTAAVVVFLALLGVRAAGFWGFLLRNPGSLDGVSARLWLTHGLWPCALAALAWAAADGIGRRLPLGGAGPEPGDRVVAAAAGLAVLAQAFFLAAWSLGAGPAVLAAFGCGVAAAAARVRPVRLAGPAGPWDGAAAGLLAFAAFAALAKALAPPTDWDVRAYHLALPALNLRAGSLALAPWMIHAHWPHLMETLYVPFLAAGRDGAAALVHLGAAVLLTAGAARRARRAAGPGAGWAAALLLAGQPVLLREAGSAHADAACALFAFAAASALARWDRGGERRDAWLAAAGFLAGACAAAKMTGVALAAGGALYAAFRARRVREPALFAAFAALVAGPWFLKAALETGAPAWPFGPGVDAAGAALAARYLASNRWGFPPPASLLTHDGPLFLLAPAAALAVLVPRPRARATGEEKVLACAAPFFLLVVWRHNEAWRFLMPLWPAVALFAARRAAQALRAGAVRRAAAGLALAAGAAPIAWASPNNELFAVLAPRPAGAPGADRRALFEDRAVDVAGFYRRARGVLPPGAKVLLFREIRGYGAGFDYEWGDPMNQALVDYRAVPGPDALAARLKALGVTHVLDHPASTLYREDPAYYDRRTLALMAETLRRHARPVLEGEGLALYQLL